MQFSPIPDGNRDQLAECLLPRLHRNDIRYFDLMRSWQEIPRTSGPEALLGPGYAVVVVQFNSQNQLVNWSLLENRDAFHWLCVYGFPVNEQHVEPAARYFTTGADRQTALNAFGFATQAPRTQRSATENPDGSRTLYYTHNLDAWLQLDVDAQDHILRYAWLSGAQVMAHFRRPQGAKKPEEVAERVDLEKIVRALHAFAPPEAPDGASIAARSPSAEDASPPATMTLQEVLAARRAAASVREHTPAPSSAAPASPPFTSPAAPSAHPGSAVSASTAPPQSATLTFRPLPPFSILVEIGIVVIGTVLVLGLSVLVAIYSTLGVGIGVLCGLGIPAAILAPRCAARRRTRRQQQSPPIVLDGGVLSVPAHAKAPAAAIDLRAPYVAATHFFFRAASTATNTASQSRATLQIRQGDTIVTLYSDELVTPKVAHSYRFGAEPGAPPLPGDGHELTFDDLMTLWKRVRPPA